MWDFRPLSAGHVMFRIEKANEFSYGTDTVPSGSNSIVFFTDSTVPQPYTYYQLLRKDASTWLTGSLAISEAILKHFTVLMPPIRLDRPALAVGNFVRDTTIAINGIKQGREIAMYMETNVLSRGNLRIGNQTVPAFLLRKLSDAHFVTATDSLTNVDEYEWRTDYQTPPLAILRSCCLEIDSAGIHLTSQKPFDLRIQRK